MACHAFLEGGADSAIFGQNLEWQVGDFLGKNEVDVIARHGDRLTFVSCKCAKSVLQAANTTAGRNQWFQLRRALDEADNWVDHFGDINRDNVILIVTTDLINEVNNNEAHSPSLFGKPKCWMWI